MKKRIVQEKANQSNPAELRMTRSSRPGWLTGSEQAPVVGQHVYCKGGMAEVVRVAGKTGDGSRLLELRLLNKVSPPFHAAASNVLIEPPEDSGTAKVHLSTERDWLI